MDKEKMETYLRDLREQKLTRLEQVKKIYRHKSVLKKARQKN